MKYLFTLLVLFLMLAGNVVLAQRGSSKMYTAQVKGSSQNSITKRDKDEITFQAKARLNGFLSLLNVLASDTLSESDLTAVIQNSYLPSQDQIFLNDAIIIEDDIDPKHTSSNNTADLKVDRYLRNLALFYSKSVQPTISFSQVIASSVVEGKEYPYIKVFFTSMFTGKNSQSDTIPYQPALRVAELKVEKGDAKNRWHTYITRLGFVRPGEGLTELSQPTIEQEGAPKQRIKGEDFLYRSLGGNPDSITVRWDSHWLNINQSSTLAIPKGSYQRSSTAQGNQNYVGITLTNKDRQLSFRRIDGTTLQFEQTLSTDYLRRLKRKYQFQGWGQLVAGVAVLGASYAGYSSLQNSYNDYTSRVNTVNGEYAIWKTLTQQPGGSTAVPLSFGQYSQPGIYAVYGGGAVGSALIINGIRYLLKAGRIKILTRR